MNALIIYFLKVQVALVLFYFLYRVLFYKDTFLVLKRIYFLFVFAVSVIYPFVLFENKLELEQSIPVFITGTAARAADVPAVMASEASFNWEGLLFIIYGSVAGVFLIRFLVRLISIGKWRKKGTVKVLDGIPVRVVNEKIAPFSFWRDIYLNPALYDENELHEVICHENSHAKQLHTLDVLIAELFLAAFWLNPFMWLLRKELRQNLEFLADDKVLRSGCDKMHYQYHLLRLSVDMPQNYISNNFNITPLKKRIIMMKKQKTKKMAMLKYICVLPLALILIAGCNVSDPKVYVNVNTDSIQMPEFPGGQNALLAFMRDSVRYPVEAQQKGEQGRVVVKFVVNDKGDIEALEVAQSVSPSLDQAALDVVAKMPKWIPGYHKVGKNEGEKVNVQFALPVTFRLSGGDEKQGLKVRPESFTEEDSPLVIVDGKAVGTMKALDDLNVEDIESVSVLKDAAVHSLDMKLSDADHQRMLDNGVIQITMKKE